MAKLKKAYWLQTKSGQWMRVDKRGARFHAPPRAQWNDKSGKLHPPPGPPKGPEPYPRRVRDRIGLRVENDLRDDADFKDKTSTDPTRHWASAWQWRWPMKSKPTISWEDMAEFFRRLNSDGLLGQALKGRDIAVQISVWMVRDESYTHSDDTIIARNLSHAVGWKGSLSQAVAACLEWDAKYEKSKVLGVGFYLRRLKTKKP